jgi:hypothetical protein
MIKASVDLRGITPQMAIAYTIACHIYWERCQVRCVITSASDGVHGPNSLHYKGKALDLRTNNIPRHALPALHADLKTALGPQFDVVLESDHIHLEHDVKEPDKQGEV